MSIIAEAPEVLSPTIEEGVDSSFVHHILRSYFIPINDAIENELSNNCLQAGELITYLSRVIDGKFEDNKKNRQLILEIMNNLFAVGELNSIAVLLNEKVLPDAQLSFEYLGAIPLVILKDYSYIFVGVHEYKHEDAHLDVEQEDAYWYAEMGKRLASYHQSADEYWKNRFQNLKH